MVSVLSAAAEAAGQVVPFHCVICFDEFNLVDRTPMVLPCGHTYVCNSCTKRLTRCMECREPLFWTPPVGSSAPITPNQPHRGIPNRYGRPTPDLTLPSTPKRQPAEPIPLPISRNVIMIAMMEAAQRQIDIIGEEADGIENEAEIRKILCGIEEHAGPCGTYAVKEPEGLAVVPRDPQKRTTIASDASLQENVVEPFIIKKGQTVQIVEVSNGVYKLAREAGFIVASDSQLVKVEGPLDSSCRLEGMLNLVDSKRRELTRALDQMQKLATGLTERIEEIRYDEPTHPIISQSAVQADTWLKSCDSGNSVSSAPVLAVSASSESTPTTPCQEIEAIEADISSPNVNLVLRAPNTIDNSDIGRQYVDERLYTFTARPGIQSPFTCATFSFLNDENDQENRRSYVLPGRSFEESSLTPSRGSTIYRSSGMSATAPASGSVNFSTGLSGHRALTSSRKSGPAQVQRQVRMMSEHRGIGSIRGPLRKTQSPASPPSASRP